MLAATTFALSSAYADYTLPDGIEALTVLNQVVMKNSSHSTVGLNSHAVTAHDSWKMNLSFSLTGAANEWGTTLLSTGSDAYANDYTGGFQIRFNNGTSNNDGKLFLKYSNNDADILTIFDQLDFNTQSTENPLTITMTLGYNADTKTLMVLTAAAGTQTLSSPVGVELSTPVAFNQVSVTGTGVSLPEGSSSTVTLLAPEPSAAMLAALAPIGLLLRRRRRGV